MLYLQTIRLDTDLCRASRLGLTGALAAAGWDVTLIAGIERDRPAMPAGVRLIGIHAPRVPFLATLWFNAVAHLIVVREVIRRPPAVLLLDPYTFHAAFPWDLLSRLGLMSTKVVMDVRSGIFHEQHRGVGNWPRRALRALSLAYARRLFAGFTTITPMLRDRLVRQFGLPADRIGIWQSAAPEMRVPEAAVGSSRAGLRVLYHGTFGMDRGLPETVQAMRLVADRRPDVELLLLGSGIEEGKLRQLAEGLPNVRFHAPVPHEQVPAFIAGADVGILPFLPTPVMRSSSPLKLIEYLSCGKPVIASRIEAVSDVVGPDGAVFLDAQTPEAIARAIVWAADHRDALDRLATRGRALVAGEFTWERQARGLQQFLRSVGVPSAPLESAVK
jgi:glycosyltransferase involved in cell wall biosynthesis